MQSSSTKPGDCEATGVLSPEKEVGGGWVEDKLSTSTCDNDNVHAVNNDNYYDYDYDDHL